MFSLWDVGLWDAGLWKDFTVQTSDATALQAALDGISATHPPVTYVVSSTIVIPAGARFDGAGVVTIKQANGANLSSIVSLQDGAQLIGVTVDGNRANNNAGQDVAVRIGNSDGCVVDRCTVQNCPGYGVVVNHGLRARITNNVIKNFYVNSFAIYADPGVPTYHRIEDNHVSEIGWAFLTAGGSHDIIRNNTVDGHLIGGPDARMTADMSGNTVTWVSGPDFSDVIVGNFIVFDGGKEFRITSVASSTSLTVSTTLPTETGMQAAIGPGDLLGLMGGSHNLVDGNTFVGGATYGIGMSQAGNFDTSYNTFSNNNISGCGKTGIVMAYGSGTGVMRGNSIVGNKVRDSGQSPAGSTLNRCGVAIAGNGRADKIFGTFIDANTVDSTHGGDGQMQYWLGTDGYGGPGEIKIGSNTASGVANGSTIYQAGSLVEAV